MVVRSSYLIKSSRKSKNPWLLSKNMLYSTTYHILPSKNVLQNAAPFSKVTFRILRSFSGLPSGHTEECVCLCYCQGWQLAFSTLRHGETVTAGVWPTPRLSALLLHPCSLACPATLLVGRSPLSIYTAYGSGQLETCSVQLGAAASWASPSFLHTSSPFLSDGRGLSLAHAHNHASADGCTIPGSGSEATHTPMLLHLHHRARRTHWGLPPLPDTMFDLWPR